MILALIPKDYDTLILVTYLFSKLSAGIGFMMVWLITAELYPTNLRAQVRENYRNKYFFAFDLPK